ncbi:aldehyde dehydrogenase family protein [Tsukamurella sp. 8F]|uniref:aldehyde dehydrogenase family protein n=1 Tax=unclassified Tsukamurella TaxID=2633480 RepID=UPI0023B9105D|nr:MULTISPECIES: aldehyde dehydrogenase family protein [unclassified Tsukamurella]MDF0529242.1 aldehyde dehydrogenase family protein [Tsukamurella sp. 8J]MDF0585427.1 aldehyde dehydrogenase family protein [Tsukamurella sp. 8F]
MALPTSRNLIDGTLVGDPDQESISPGDGAVLGLFAAGGEPEAAAAIEAAARAFDSTEWSRDRHLRHRVLNAVADRIEARTDELALALARENGKILREAHFELSLTVPKLRYYAALALTDAGRAIEVSPGLHMRSVAEPAGVAGVIVPWNSPIVLAVRSFAPALAAGCTVAMKMPAQTGIVNGILHEILADTPGLPAGVINSVTESGSALAQALVSSPDVEVVSYTGSTAVGRTIMANAARHLKRLSLELGGKSPMIVFDDADLEAVVPTLTAAVTTFAGQFCMTGSRVLAHSAIAGELRERLVASLGTVHPAPGDALDSPMGPMIDAATARRVEKVLADAEADTTVEVLLRGGQVGGPDSAFVAPALLAPKESSHPVVQGEIFGPVATFEVFETEDEAVELANATDYGLAASVWSRDIDRPTRVARRIKAGTVWTNTWAVVADEFEEGGFKQSGVGRLNGVGALAEFQEVKTYVHNVGA